MRLHRSLLVAVMLQTSLWGAPDSFRDLASDLVDQAGIPIEKTVIAVLPFEDNTEGVKNTRLGEAVAEELTTALIKRGIRVAERAELRKVLREHELRQSGTISDSEAATLAKGLGAAVVVGTVRRTDSGAIRVNARLVQISDMRALSAGSINLDRDLVEKYQSPEKRKKRDTITIDLMGGVSFYQLQWTRRYQENIANPVTSGFSDQYFTAENYDSVPTKPGMNGAVRFAYFPMSNKGYGSLFFLSFGFQYIQVSSQAANVSYSVTKNSQYSTPGTTNPATIRQSGSVGWADGAHSVSIFATRPGLFFRINLSDSMTFFYFGPQLNLMSLRFKNPISQQGTFTWNLDFTVGLRIDFGSVGLLLEGSAPFLNTYSYADAGAGILQDKSTVTLTGGNIAAGLSFKL